eukprot:9499528-Pyramimonas_sp.AAC.1
MDLLTKDPAPPDQDVADPVITHPHVKWMRYRHSLVTYYFNTDTQKMASRSMKVETGTPEFVQSKIDMYGQILEDFYQMRHNKS